MRYPGRAPNLLRLSRCLGVGGVRNIFSEIK
uniref:Uncharacterized protein n=1 Tax=Anguilla anguilla TaxID=7936 RepID=A0A0E9PWJ3_ANGAN